MKISYKTISPSLPQFDFFSPPITKNFFFFFQNGDNFKKKLVGLQMPLNDNRNIILINWPSFLLILISHWSITDPPSLGFVRILYTCSLDTNENKIKIFVSIFPTGQIRETSKNLLGFGFLDQMLVTPTSHIIISTLKKNSEFLFSFGIIKDTIWRNWGLCMASPWFML